MVWRAEIAEELFLHYMKDAEGLGSASENEAKSMIKRVAKISFMAADTFLEENKEQ